jgi:DnaJ like chaperone protein
LSWIGKILGGGLGLAFGGPLGAVLGAVIGHHAIDSGASSQFTSLETRQSIYFTAVFSMLGKLAKADGVVSQEEIAVVEQVMHANPQFTAEIRQIAIEIFNAAKDSEDGFEDYAAQLRDEFGQSKEILVSVLELLCSVAQADKVLHPAELAMLAQAASIFGVQAEYEHIRHRLFDRVDDLTASYEVLGCDPGDSLATVKRSYRRLAMEYHPDRIQAKGLAPEFAPAAEDKFKEIQHAWDVVEKHLRQA